MRINRISMALKFPNRFARPLSTSDPINRFARPLSTNGFINRFASITRPLSTTPNLNPTPNQNPTNPNLNTTNPTNEEDDLHIRPASTSRFSLARPIERIFQRLTRDADLARFFAKATAVSLYTLTAVTVLGTIGVDTKPLIAGIGVTGFTIGFALKEIATNFLSGVMLVMSKPFEKGQHLRVLSSTGNALEGQVESIDVRYVILRSKERGLIMVPSVMVYTSPLLVIRGKKESQQ